jgi:hypothetical protein
LLSNSTCTATTRRLDAILTKIALRFASGALSRAFDAFRCNAAAVKRERGLLARAAHKLGNRAVSSALACWRDNVKVGAVYKLNPVVTHSA